jgi:hypothetical protein
MWHEDGESTERAQPTRARTNSDELGMVGNLTHPGTDYYMMVIKAGNKRLVPPDQKFQPEAASEISARCCHTP